MVHRLGEIARLFLKLGTISFGGPAAHVAIMEEEVVRRRHWISREHFLDLIAATHLVPGPNAVEMASHVGYHRARLAGSLVAGICFSLPAVGIAIGCAWAYQHGYGGNGESSPLEPCLNGIRAAVLAIIFTAVFRLGRKALRTWQLMLIGGGVAAGSLAGYDEVLTLLAGSLIGVMLLGWSRRGTDPPGKITAGALAGTMLAGAARTAPAATTTVAVAGAAASVAGPVAVPLWKMALFFLKVGVVFFGGGYVLVAYLDGRVPEWLTQQELLDAVAIGQLTPGPMLSMVTFIGYLIGARGGYPVAGAVAASAAILLPSFFFVAAVNPLIPRLRKSPWASRFLDAVGAAAIGLMGAVTLTLCRATFVDSDGFPWVDWRGALIALAAGTVLLRWKVAPAWLVLAGAVAGWLLF